MRTQQWGPDTCKCVFEQTFDGDTFVSAIAVSTCAFHTLLAEGGKHDAVMNENVNKNQVLGKVIAAHPELCDEVTVKGQTTRSLKEDYEYVWSFDKDRKLEIEVTGLDPTQKAAVALTLIDEEVTVKSVTAK